MTTFILNDERARIVDYNNSKYVGSKASESAKSVVDALTGHGFRVLARRDVAVELAGPSMSSSTKNPLVGASKVVVRVESGQVMIEAEFVAQRRFMRRIGVFVFGMDVSCVVLFVLLIPPEHFVIRFVLPVLFLVPSLIAVPWMSCVFRRRTAKAFDVLLQDAAAR